MKTNIIKPIVIKTTLSKYMDITDNYVYSFDGESVSLDSLNCAILDICTQVLNLASDQATTEVVQMSCAGSIRIVNKESITNLVNNIQ